MKVLCEEDQQWPVSNTEGMCVLWPLLFDMSGLAPPVDSASDCQVVHRLLPQACGSLQIRQLYAGSSCAFKKFRHMNSLSQPMPEARRPILAYPVHFWVLHRVHVLACVG